MNILSFDIEEWYLYRTGGEAPSAYLPRLDGYLDRLLDLLEAREVKGTFFCLGVIAREHPGVVRKILARGHEIGCHSDRHRWLTEFTRQEFAEDTRAAVDSLEQAAGCKIKSYRAPAFSIGERNKWAFEVLAENGIERDCSIFPAARDFGGFPGFPEHKPSIVDCNGSRIKEFPIPTLRVLGREIVYSGGGYFRLMPYALIRHQVAEEDYTMTYFHLRDFDREQPRKFGIRCFKDYYGINGAWDKFRRLLGDFQFVSVEQADSAIDWQASAEIKL